MKYWLINNLVYTLRKIPGFQFRRPCRNRESIETFYTYITWLNDSAFNSFIVIDPNTTTQNHLFVGISAMWDYKSHARPIDSHSRRKKKSINWPSVDANDFCAKIYYVNSSFVIRAKATQSNSEYFGLILDSTYCPPSTVCECVCVFVSFSILGMRWHFI